MAIITFRSDEQKETGQSLSVAAIAAQMAIEHNYKILIVSTSFKEQTLEGCFWEMEKNTNQNQNNLSVDSGIEGLIRVLSSNKTSSEIVKNYSKTILRDRLDMLLAPTTDDYNQYLQICSQYPEILRTADRYYDLIFVDLSRRMRKIEKETIINISDVVVVNLIQRLKTINEFIELKETNDFFKRRNVMVLMGRYDEESKYNAKNITRYMKEKKLILTVPYNTLYFEACSEGKVIDFLLKFKSIDETDKNNVFIKEVNRVNENIIYKLQELQMKS